ncbi:ribonuclease H family protein [Shinella sp.]|uniref:ribonuclease H family protein n=1 Tax=Shinella sp. TaxID=1870904 RepID=UPI003F6E830B
MTYTFPETLSALRKYLKSKGFQGNSVKTSRQAAFIAQQLLGTRVKFPPIGQDMTSVLMKIQKSVPVKGQRPPNSASARIRNTCDFSSGLHFFCDGASIPNPGVGGWGVVVYRDGVEVASQCGGDPETTNNQMELTALLVAIERAGQLSGISGELVTIWSDSQYAVDGANVWLQSWKARGWNKKKLNSPNRADGEIKNVYLWRAIDAALGDALATESLAIKWVKGHAGVAGNERADELAEIGRQANESFSQGNGSFSPLTEDLDERFREIMRGGV